MAASFQELSLQLFEEINKVRLSPSMYSTTLEAVGTQFHGLNFYRKSSVPLVTTEGIRALHNASEDLKTRHEVSVLQWSNGLAFAA
jgi:hypothetical protein